MKFRLILSGLLILSTLTGCISTRVARWSESTASKNFDKELAATLEAAGDEHFKKRYDQLELSSALEKWEAASEANPTTEIFAKLSRGYYLLADGFFGLQDKTELRDKTFTKGLGFAEKAVQLAAPKVVAKVKSGASWSDEVKNAPEKAVPGLYWQAVNMGKWAASQGFLTKLKYKDDIKSTMDRVMALDPDYFYSAPFRYFGAYEAATSGLAGGSLEKSNENFAAAAKKSPNYLATKVLWAEYWAIKTQNKSKFESLLNEVLVADPTVNPLIEPENRIEQKKAKKLIAAIEEHF